MNFIVHGAVKKSFDFAAANVHWLRMNINSSMISVLHLNLHHEFFARIAVGTKRTEYRQRTAYWKTRLENRHYDVIHFRNGYATKAPEMLVEFLGVRKSGKGRTGKYAIRLGRILKIERWRGQIEQ
jgi:hypothetical protein